MKVAFRRRASSGPAAPAVLPVQGLRGRRWTWRLGFGLLLFLLIVGTQWAWIDCDGGTPSLNEYGYFATDEGYYCAGGKNQYLFGQMVNMLRGTPNTYAISPGLHVLTWGAFSAFGQTLWAHRVFPMLIHLGAWLALFAYLARRTPAPVAAALCAACLLNPLLLAYSRTASNDILVGSIALAGYVLARGRRPYHALLGGAVFGLGVWAKASIWMLAVLGLSAALMAATPRERLRRAMAYAAGFGLAVLASWGAIRLLIVADAVAQGVTVRELLAASDSSYPLPNPLHLLSTCKLVAAFPRYPTDGLLGMWVPLLVVLPALLLLRRLTDGPVRWDGRLLLYATFLAYAGGIMILPVYYAHYFLPLLLFVPVLWTEARRDLARWHGARRPLLPLALLSVALAWIFFDFYHFRVPPERATELTPFLTNAYVMPQRVMWDANGWHILVAALLLAGCILLMRQQVPRGLLALGIAVTAVGVAEVCFALLPMCEAYRYCELLSRTTREAASSIQLGSVALLFVVWGLPRFVRRGWRWPLLLPALLGCGLLLNPVWRHGIVELAERQHRHRQAVAELAAALPGAAVVFGERAPQLCLGLKVRAAGAVNQDPVPMVLKMRQAHPERPLFALLDAEHTYHYDHYQKAQDRIRMQVVRTLRLASFANGTPVNVYLVYLDILAATPAATVSATSAN
jgi:hypothetical protein